MRILVLHSRYRSAAPSGENNVVDAERALLSEAGHEVASWERRSDDIAGWPIRQRVALPARSVYHSAVRRELAARLAATRPDVVHVHNTFPLLSPSVLDACRDAAVPVVATLHNYKLLCASGDFFRAGSPCHDCADGAVLPGLLHGCYRGSRLATAPIAAGLVLNRSAWRQRISAYVFISAAQRALMAGLQLPAERVFVKHNASLSRPAPEADRLHRVAYLGRLDAAKGIPFLTAAWDRYRVEHPRSPLRLAIAGDGPLAAEVRRWAAGHDRVDVLGHLTKEAAADLVAGSLAVVVPSSWEETFGLVAVEAMAAGVAPVVPDRGSFPELVTDGVDGLHFRAGDLRSLAGRLAAIDAHPDRCQELGVRARQTHRDRFLPARNLAELLAIYQFAIDHPVDAAPTRATLPA